MAQRARDAANRFQRQTVTGLAIAFHIDRFKADAIARRTMTITAIQPGLSAIGHAQAARHAGDTASLLQMEVVGKFEAIAILRLRIEGDTLILWLHARHGLNTRAELGVRRAKVTRIADPRVGQPFRHVGMTIGAKTLSGCGHRPFAFMFGMTINTATLFTIKSRTDADQRRSPRTRFPARSKLPGRRRVVMRILMAGFTSGIGNRDKCVGMAGLAIAG